jgi:hypothetical protein
VRIIDFAMGTAHSHFKIRLCLNMGWLYIRMVAHNSFAPEPEEIHADGSEEEPSEDSPLIPSALSSRLQGSIHEFMAMYASMSSFVDVLTFPF